MKRLVLGTRGSALALWQAHWVAEALQREHEGLEVALEIIQSDGDLNQDVPIGAEDVGVFVRRIERALLDDRIDLAVHSLKDLPTDQPAQLTLAALPVRHDPRDALLTRDGATLDALSPGAKVGTSSPRRRTQLLHARPDLQIVPMRGNVDTRLRRLAEGDFDAVVLALAGVERLGLHEVPRTPIDPEVCLPAVGQGALAVQVRADDSETRRCVAALDDPHVRRQVVAERSFLRALGGGCLAPATAHATFDAGEGAGAGLLRGLVGDLDGKRLLQAHVAIPDGGEEAAGRELAEILIGSGADRLLEEARRR